MIQQGSAQNDGENLLMRWRHVCDERLRSGTANLLDHYDRFSDLNRESARTLDVDYQYRFPVWDRQEITCGAGYRHIDSALSRNHSPKPTCRPKEACASSTSSFRMRFRYVPDLLELIMGCKLEENNFTGLEYQPTARLLWTPDRRHSVWGAVSWAVRITLTRHRSGSSFHVSSCLRLRVPADTG